MLIIFQKTNNFYSHLKTDIKIINSRAFHTSILRGVSPYSVIGNIKILFNIYVNF